MMKSAGYYYRGGNLLFLTMFSMMCQKKTSLAFVTDRCWHHARCSSSMMIVRGGSISSSSSSSVAIEASTSTTTTTTTSTSMATKATTTMTAKEAYQELVTKLETITHLSRVQSVLSYDQLVFMPSSALADRGQQLSALAGVFHDRNTDAQLKQLLDRVVELDNNNNTASIEQQAGSLEEEERTLIALERKAFVENERIPTVMAAKAAGLSSSAYGVWITAKEKQDFSVFAPTLQECFDTAMELATAKRGSIDDDDGKSGTTMSLYDQMLDQYEVGMGQSRIDQIFAEVQAALVPLIERVLTSPSQPSSEPLHGNFSISKQQQLSEQLVTAIGYDRGHGRIDVSVHPFSSSMSASDVRITSRFREEEWYQGLAGTLHEGGHAIYEQNLVPSAVSIDAALSMGTHESQSLFWERHIGLSKPFWKFAHPFLGEYLDASFEKYTADDIYGAVNRVSNSLIRVEADELTYPLHVILRYNIEKDVMGGTLAVADISQRWNEDMKSLLDVEVTSEDQGVLQDVHWSAMAFGYFPTYLIGAVAAAQLYHYCQQEIPDMESKIEQGDFQPIKEWLTLKIHQHGRRYPSLDRMFEDQLGEALNPTYFIEYLTTKYTNLYQLDN